MGTISVSSSVLSIKVPSNRYPSSKAHPFHFPCVNVFGIDPIRSDPTADSTQAVHQQDNSKYEGHWDLAKPCGLQQNLPYIISQMTGENLEFRHSHICHWFQISESLVKKELDSMSYVITPIKPCGREGRKQFGQKK